MEAVYAYGNFEMGCLATIIGMGGVFAILAILTFTTWLLNKVVDSIVKDPTPPAAAKAAAPAAAPATAAAPKANNNAKIAAIMAAVSMAMGSEQLKFTAIQRNSGSVLPWAASGNADIMADRASYTKGGQR